MLKPPFLLLKDLGILVDLILLMHSKNQSANWKNIDVHSVSRDIHVVSTILALLMDLSKNQISPKVIDPIERSTRPFPYDILNPL